MAAEVDRLDPPLHGIRRSLAPRGAARHEGRPGPRCVPHRPRAAPRVARRLRHAAAERRHHRRPRQALPRPAARRTPRGASVSPFVGRRSPRLFVVRRQLGDETPAARRAGRDLRPPRDSALRRARARAPATAGHRHARLGAAPDDLRFPRFPDSM